MDITNPVLFEVLAARPFARGRGLHYLSPPRSRSRSLSPSPSARSLSRRATSLSRRATSLSRRALEFGSNRRPFPRVGFNAPPAPLLPPRPRHPEPQSWRADANSRHPEPRDVLPPQPRDVLPPQPRHPGPQEGAGQAPEADAGGWQESAGLLAVAALTLMALLV